MSHEMPRIFISPPDHKHLKRIVTDAYNAGKKTATFLDSELRRAEVCETLPSHVVTPGSFVRYQLDWGPFSPVRELVYPENFICEDTQVSLLSPIGIALLGMRRGDTMQVLIPEVGFQTLHVATIVYPEVETTPTHH
jgi:regulator of nucleoside diphosphate kinase